VAPASGWDAYARALTRLQEPSDAEYAGNEVNALFDDSERLRTLSRQCIKRIVLRGRQVKETVIDWFGQELTLPGDGADPVAIIQPDDPGRLINEALNPTRFMLPNRPSETDQDSPVI
jgi:hypothetical protein